ncbi:hypothetical protein NMM52_19810, partial [Acinetobacter baumannii]|nr:hypothetical protein [Acinetobacter baumannii]
SNVMLWLSMKTMRTFHFTRLQQSLESIVPRFSPGFSKVKSADVVYEFFRIVGDRLAGIGSGTGLGVVGH